MNVFYPFFCFVAYSSLDFAFIAVLLKAMKKRAVEIARGDPQSAADQKKIEVL